MGEGLSVDREKRRMKHVFDMFGHHREASKTSFWIYLIAGGIMWMDAWMAGNGWHGVLYDLEGLSAAFMKPRSELAW